MTSPLHQSSYNLPMPSQPDPTLYHTHLGSPRIASSHSQARPIQEAPFMPTWRSKEEFDRYIRDLVQGAASQPFSIESMCHCLNVNLPHWYKIPKFKKFNGKGDPQHHLRLFVNETLPEKDNKIFLFQKSLEGDAAMWVGSLPVGSFTTFEELAAKFMSQYSYLTSTYHIRPSRQFSLPLWIRPNLYRPV